MSIQQVMMGLYGGGLHPYTEAYINALPYMPSDGQIRLTDELVRGMVADGVWNLYDAFYLLKTNTPSNALINLVNPGTYTLVHTGGTVPFTAGLGFASAVNNNYLQTVENVSTMPKYSRNNAHLFVYAETAPVANTGLVGTTSNVLELRPNSSSYVVSMCNMNYNATDCYLAGGGSGAAFLSVSRLSSSIQYTRRNNTLLGTSSVGVSVAVPAATFKICGGISGLNASVVSFAGLGSYLDASGDTAVKARLDAYRSGYDSYKGAPYVASTSKGNKTAVTPVTTVTMPTGKQEGDLLVVIISGMSSAVASAVTPAGWTRAGASAATGSYLRYLEVYYKFSDGTETSVNFNANTNVLTAWHSFAVRNAVALEVPTMAGAVTATAPNCPSITPSWGSSLPTLYIAAGAQTTQSVTPQSILSGYTAFDQDVAPYVDVDGPRVFWSSKTVSSSPEDPPAYANSIVLSSVYSGWMATTIAIK